MTVKNKERGGGDQVNIMLSFGHSTPLPPLSTLAANQTWQVE